MSNRVVPKWLAGALVAMLVLGAISVINAAQAAPAFHPLTAPLKSSVQSKAPQDKPAPPAQGNPLTGLLTGMGQPGNGAAPAASGITYQINNVTHAPISGTTDIGNHCDDCVTAVSFPFPVTFYGSSYSTANASSNGNLQFNSTATNFTSNCLPDSNFTDAIFVFWDDLDTSAAGRGIFTAVLGSSPNRQFVIEWRDAKHSGGQVVDAELIFYENSTTISAVYGSNPDNGSNATAGVQEGDGSGGNSHSEYSCHNPNLTPGLGLDYVPQQGPTPTPTATPNPCAVGWSEQAAYPSHILGSATVAQGGRMYSFGGTPDGSTIVATSYKYDGTSWSAIASLPNPAALASAVSDGTYIYILNGENPGNVITNTLTRYDPVANTYSMRASPVYTSAAQAAVYLNGNIYRIGGVGAPGNSALNSVEVYDIASNTWSSAANYPTPIALESAVTIGGYIYTAGGNTSNSLPDTVTNKTYRYNPTANLWEDGQIDDLPQRREAAAADVFNGQFLIAGGVITGTGVATFTNTALSWNPSGNLWTNLPNMVVPRGLNSGATLGGAFYSVGGADLNSHPTNDNQRYAPNGCSTPTPGGPTPTTCPVPFTDIGGNIFYNAIVYLYCRGVVNGTDPTHYSPAGTSTRAQFAKVVVLGFGIPFYTPGTPDFTDVPPGYFAYLYIETGFHAGILSGFDAAGCTAHGATYPCYLPNIPITRAQLTKLVVGAAHYPLFTPTGGGQTFSDVPNTNIFYVSIETAHYKGVINGYPDGTFRPNNNIRRDEMAQIVYKGVTTP